MLGFRTSVFILIPINSIVTMDLPNKGKLTAQIKGSEVVVTVTGITPTITKIEQQLT
jgi:hypothetical protein